MALAIRKKGNKNFWHYWDSFQYSSSDVVAIFDGDYVKIRATNGRIIGDREGYIFTDVTIYDDTASGTPETFGSIILLEQRLINLGYPAFYQDGDVLPEALVDLTDVDVVTPATGQTIIYNEVTSKWENQSPAGGGDMLKSVYDPTNVNGDAFATDNFKQPTASKTTPIDADELNVWDSVASVFKRLSWSNIKATLKDYFDTLYEPVGSGGVTDGDKGDVTVSDSGTTWTIDNNVVSNAKLAQIATATIKGRATASTGNVEDLSASQVRTIINVEDGADVTDATNVNAAGAVMESDYNANTILAANSDDTPLPLEITEQTLLGRIASGNIAPLSVTQIKSLLAYIESDINGVALYNATTTGAVNIDCATFSSWYRILTGNSNLTFTNTPASGFSFTRFMTIKSDTAETLAFGNADYIVGEYANDTSENFITVELSNYPTVGLQITVYINQEA